MTNFFESDQYVQLKPADQIDPKWVSGIPHEYVLKFCEKPVKIVTTLRHFGETLLLVRADGTPLSYYVDSKAVKSIIGKERRENIMESRDFITCWQEVHTIIDDAMEKRDRTVSIFFNPVTGMSVTVHPWPDADELWDMYQDGKITANEFREKMGLPRVEVKSWDELKMDVLNKDLQIPKE